MYTHDYEPHGREPALAQTIIIRLKTNDSAALKGRGFMKTALLRGLLYALGLTLAAGCSTLRDNTSTQAWSQIAARENDQQHFNASTQSDGEFYPFGAP